MIQQLRDGGVYLAQACEGAASGLAKTSEGQAAEVERLVAPAINAMGYAIVRILLSGNRRPRLQIMAERHDGTGMNVDDCASVSRAVAAILDVEEPIQGPYELEVSSPGIDRPLTRLADFARFAGFEARLETSFPVEGRRRWRGRLLGLAGEQVRLATEGGEVVLPFAGIARAKLLMTDELIAAAQSGERDSNEGRQ
jgi:ribosome maturation factor RimP